MDNNESKIQNNNIPKYTSSGCIKALLLRYNINGSKKNILIIKRILKNWDKLINLRNDVKFFNTHSYIGEDNGDELSVYSNDNDFEKTKSLKHNAIELFFNVPIEHITDEHITDELD
jgi:hypothetical protein